MPPVNWTIFEQLPGAATTNFELLCRALIRLHYGRFGAFSACANQPGVEFHLKLHTDCTLGRVGQWYGWQCRWYDLPSGRPIGTTRRNKIIEAIRKTERVLPDLTDWILWTRYTLTEGDQAWFKSIQTKMNLKLLTAVEIEEYLSGEAAIFRSTYFGELVLLPPALAKLHEEAIAPIRRRWQPEVHQTIDAERILRRKLGEVESWNSLLEHIGQLKDSADAVALELSTLPATLSGAISELIELARSFENTLSEIHTALNQFDSDVLQQSLSVRPSLPSQEITALPRSLRNIRHPSALTVTNTLADIHTCFEILNDLQADINTRLIAVIAEAGCGKTELAAQLTVATQYRPAGILLHGKRLQAGQILDDLANQIVIQGIPVPSMEALLAALDAAGQRAHRRLPIIIDGLNESEDTRDWKDLLAPLFVTLKHYPHILVICTLRTIFVEQILPPEVAQIEIPDFDHDVKQAIDKYFDYYRIDATDVDLPIQFLSHPLMLRLFCEVTNPARDRVVGIEAMPGSPSAIFDSYLQQCANRIAELAPRSWQHRPMDVRIALGKIGILLWQQTSRTIDNKTLRRQLGDEGRQWHQTMIHALEQEGILLRDRGKLPDEEYFSVVYDALAGHLAADAILAKYDRNDLKNVLFDAGISPVMTSASNRHPLADDIFRALVGLSPRRDLQQLWTLLDEPLQTLALRETTNLESSYLDTPTVNALASLVVLPSSPVLFARLWQTRGASAHPLNADFLDDALRSMTMSERDLHWTEWVRRNERKLLSDCEELETRWRNNMVRTSSDRLRAIWLMWLQTSTVRKLRDYATRTLYWYGREAPQTLLELTLHALSVNDPYVPERMLATVYGVAMAYQHPVHYPHFVNEILPEFGRKLYEELFAPDAPYGTTHILAREYAQRTIQLALIQHPALLSAEEQKHITGPFTFGGIRSWSTSNDRYAHRYREGDNPLGFDFGNYTLGRLVEGRSPYDNSHLEYQTVKANILWRIYELGYTLEAFSAIDQQIANSDRSGRAADGSKTERYGKKYAWIAYFELAGFRKDHGLLKEYQSERLSDVDIDPSFPNEPVEGNIEEPDLLGDRTLSFEQWIQITETPDVSAYCVIAEIDGKPGPWVLLQGFMYQEEYSSNRKMFVFLNGLFCNDTDVDEVKTVLSQLRDAPHFDPPTDYYTYAGEIPWSESYPLNEEEEIEEILYFHSDMTHEVLVFYRDGNQLNKEEMQDLESAFSVALQSCNPPLTVDFIPENEDEKHLWIEALMSVLKDKGIKFSKQIVKDDIECTGTLFRAVRENNWESHHTASTSGRTVLTPARQLTDYFALLGRPQTFDLFDEAGDMASCFIHKGQRYHIEYTLAYLRQDLLERFLAETSQSLMWALRGGREYTSERHQDVQAYAQHSKFHQSFQEITVYSSDKSNCAP